MHSENMANNYWKRCQLVKMYSRMWDNDCTLDPMFVYFYCVYSDFLLN